MKEKTRKKNIILKTTLELIAEQGFHGTSVSQIAEKADMNIGSVYYYFTNKDEILNALYIDCKIRATQHAFHNCSTDIPPERADEVHDMESSQLFNKKQSSFILYGTV